MPEPVPPPRTAEVRISVQKLAPGDAFAPSDHVSWREVEGEAIVLDLRTGEYHTFNEVGRVIWRCVAEKKPVGQILSAVTADYEAEPAAVHADIERFLAVLLHKGLVRKTTEQTTTT